MNELVFVPARGMVGKGYKDHGCVASEITITAYQGKQGSLIPDISLYATVISESATVTNKGTGLRQNGAQRGLE